MAIYQPVINVIEVNHSAIANNSWYSVIASPSFIGTIAGLIIGGFITYFYQRILKNRDIKYAALNNAHYIAHLLCQQRASLKKIEDFISDRESNKPQQKNFMQPTFLEIKQESIEKILMYNKFFQYDYANVIQSLVSSEQSYKNCFKLMEQYNETVQKLLELKARTEDQEILNLKIGHSQEIDSNIKNIKAEYTQAVTLNEQTKKHFDSLCKNVYGKLYKVLNTDGFKKSTDIFSPQEAE